MLFFSPSDPQTVACSVSPTFLLTRDSNFSSLHAAASRVASRPSSSLSHFPFSPPSGGKWLLLLLPACRMPKVSWRICERRRTKQVSPRTTPLQHLRAYRYRGRSHTPETFIQRKSSFRATLSLRKLDRKIETHTAQECIWRHLVIETANRAR